MDKSRRMPATAANCYTRKNGDFLPCFKGAASDGAALFYPEHKSKQVYLLCDDAFLADAQALHCYSAAVLKLF